MKGQKGTETMGHSVIIKYGTSRGAETYGYTTCSAWIDGKRLGSCSGGGYDLGGTALGEAVLKRWPKEIFALADRAASVWDKDTNRSEHRRDAQYLYGLSATIQGGKVVGVSIDGACGFDCVRTIIGEALGMKLRFVDETRSRKVYMLDPMGDA
jgi:hypothetical protein